MDGAIDEGGRKEESGVGSDLSDSSIFEYSADES